jgi:hypothetical protein
MPFPEIFPASATLEDLQRTLITFQKAQIANLISIQGRNAELDDGTKLDVNLAEFDPKDDRSDVNKVLVLVENDDATTAFLAQMATQSMTQLGGAGKKWRVFIKGDPVNILIFFKKS